MFLDNGLTVCNICGNSKETTNEDRVFLVALLKDKSIHICNGCIPRCAHGLPTVMSDEEAKEKHDYIKSSM